LKFVYDLRNIYKNSCLGLLNLDWELLWAIVGICLDIFYFLAGLGLMILNAKLKADWDFEFDTNRVEDFQRLSAEYSLVSYICLVTFFVIFANLCSTIVEF
jgi:hypothetical protein